MNILKTKEKTIHAIANRFMVNQFDVSGFSDMDEAGGLASPRAHDMLAC